jgi:hypothetical protein
VHCILRSGLSNEVSLDIHLHLKKKVMGGCPLPGILVKIVSAYAAELKVLIKSVIGVVKQQ